MIEEEQVAAVEVIIKDINQLQPLAEEIPEDEESGDYDDIEESALIGIILLYFFVERQLNHMSGGFLAAQNTLQALKELYNYDFDNFFYKLIRTMMADFRLQHNNMTEELSENTKLELA